ncbi:MAG: hypothetical protein M3Y41_17495 [Pseudomonadota bacterium]|nr:hypothetical protein [Pseudomonadota bacterium]
MSGNGVCLAAVLALVIVTNAEAQYVERSPPPQTIAYTAARFKAIYSQTGMIGLASAIQDCYDTNLRDNRELLNCMLLDVASIKFDNGIRQQFIARGMTGAVTAPLSYFSDSAISARLNIYTGILFNGNTNAAISYLSSAADKVIEQATPR